MEASAMICEIPDWHFDREIVVLKRKISLIRVRADTTSRTRGRLSVARASFPCVLGRSGLVTDKREGDGGTPMGHFRPRRLWWRGDRHSRPRTFLPARIITGADAWCEDPADRHYNQPIRLTQGEAGDRLTRQDHLYDFIVEIDHNSAPRVAGRGSAVFLHLARDNFGPTAGCVSMTKAAMLQLLRRLGPRTRIIIG